jgi:ABC-2 type transport system ATP-binding protein
MSVTASAPLPHLASNPAPASAMITLERASRWYGQVIGLNDVSCQIGPGLTALLGPNGAGKSTLIKLITGQLRPTTGRVLVMGEGPFANARVLSKLGYCPEIDNFYEEMTGREFVTQLAAMSGYSGRELKSRVDHSIERVGMADRCDRQIGGYSKGMRQRVKVAQAILHDPKVLVLDEPLNGLDPVGRREITDLMTMLAQEGCCVLVSSHILYEVEQLTDSILLMQRGRLLARGSVEDIRNEMDRDTHTPRHIVLKANQVRALAADLLSVSSVTGVRFDAYDTTFLEVETNNPRAFFHELPGIVLGGGYEIESLRSPDDHLEAILRNLLNRK